MNDKDQLTEKQIASQKVYDGGMLHVFRDDIELPDGNASYREYISHDGAVCVVAITADNKVVMEHQYRYPIGRVISEIPAGKLDSPQEDRLEAAKRELREETGITADEWVNLGNFLSAPAYSEENITMFLATGLHWGERSLDEGEFINVYEVSLESLVEDILAGRIEDAKTQAAVLKAYMRIHK